MSVHHDITPYIVFDNVINVFLYNAPQFRIDVKETK